MTTTEDIAVLHRIAASLSAELADGGVTAAAIEAEVVSPGRARSLVQERDEAKDRVETVEAYAAETIAEAQAETTAAVTALEKAEQKRDEAKAFATLWKRTAREQVRRTRLIAGRTRVQADYIGRLRREVEKARQQGDVDPLPIIDEVARQDGVIHELRKQLEDVERAATASPRPLTADDVDEDALDRAQEVWETSPECEDVRVTFGRALRAALTPPPSREAQEAAKIEALVDAWKLLPESPDCPRPTLADFLAERGVRVTGAES